VSTRRWRAGGEMARGKRTVVWALASDGDCPAKDFYDSLEERDQAKVRNLFDMMAEQGFIKNREKFKPIEGKLYEFKAFQIRLPCFFDRTNRVVVTHGFRKKKDDIPKSEIKRAQEILDNYDE
jgi:phage-related protein